MSLLHQCKAADHQLAATAKSAAVVSDLKHQTQPTRLCQPGAPGKNTGAALPFSFQCMKAKEGEVAAWAAPLLLMTCQTAGHQAPHRAGLCEY